jgi:hypothetical protein
MNLTKEFQYAAALSACKTTGDILMTMQHYLQNDYVLTAVDKAKIVAALTSATFLPKKTNYGPQD